MSLQSQLFRSDPKLEAAAVSDPAHILPGAVGQHVAKIQQALIILDEIIIDSGELQSSRYGSSTANAVLSYKKKRNIINRSYQTQADNIVGIMTIKSLDSEMLLQERGKFTPDEIASIMGPPIVEPIPGFDAIAPDGFVIPIPRTLRTPQGSKLLDHAMVSVYVQSTGYVMVVDNITSADSHPNAKAAAKATAQAAAKRTANETLKYKSVPGRIISFGIGRIAGGVVSVIASILEPSPIVNETHWNAEISGKRVHYIVLH